MAALLCSLPCSIRTIDLHYSRGTIAFQPSNRIPSRVGVEILKRGGNAVDAAVAVGLALAVTWPGAGNIGGGGFMVIRKADGTAVSIDYRERAPAKARRDLFLDSNGNVIPDMSIRGHRAVGVPGTVAGFALALEKYGTMKWRDVIEPARKLASEGFRRRRSGHDRSGDRHAPRRIRPT